ncbi:MAG: hypothetical protein COB83_07830 [Gammaproteobacteria bacterium]|nr:MAG: hypothetical protein COB83_07830 [Gammaproteobacteria bacterium]
MKNILILIVAAAVFLHFYPQPEVTKFYNETKASLLDDFAEFSDTSVRLKSDKIYIDLKPKLASFSADEVAALKELTSSRNNVNSFFQTYCKGKKSSAIFHPSNQSKICATIRQYENML